MTREQFLAALAIVAVLAGAAKEFYDMKASTAREIGDLRLEVKELRLHLQYLSGSNWHPPGEKE